jgi:hypothetical protein
MSWERTERELAIDPALTPEVRVANAMQPYFHNFTASLMFADWLVLNWDSVKQSVEL